MDFDSVFVLTIKYIFIYFCERVQIVLNRTINIVLLRILDEEANLMDEGV